MLQRYATSSSETSELPDILSQVIRNAESLGNGFESISGQLKGLRERLAQGRFHLAVLGQFKRGKSTLLNAMIGEAVLPASVVPLTAIPTFIKPGKELFARVLFDGDREAEEFLANKPESLRNFLTRFVTESENPKNTLGVTRVEVLHPAELLQKGVVLIDTPGIGSTFRHNTEATLNFLPQCDAALFLVSADPPVTEVEIEFLKQVRSKIERLFFILNKVDYLTPEERDTAELFLRKVLEEQAGVPADTRIFCVSAKEALEARISGDNAQWSRSGLAEVEQHLVKFLASEKSSTLRQAISHKAVDFVREILMRLRLALRSLQMPLEELDRRLGVFGEKIQEIKNQRLLSGDILSGDNKRMHEFLEEHAANLRQNASDYLKDVVQKSMNGDNGLVVNEPAVQKDLAEVIPGFFEHLFGETSELFHKRSTEILSVHQKRGDELIESIRKTAADLFEIPYQAPQGELAFEMVMQPYWETHKWKTTLNPIPPGMLDKFLPESLRLKFIRKRAEQQVGDLVVANIENLRWATFQSIDQAFRQFGSSLDRRLAETIDATHGAIQAAVERRKKQSEAVSTELKRTEASVLEFEQLQAELERI